MSKFQLILLSIFGAFIVIGVIAFSMARGGGVGATNVVIWGDIAGDAFNRTITSFGGGDANLPRIQYVYKPADTFSADLTEAIATGSGPDLVIMNLSNIEKNKNKILVIPESSLSQSDFKNTFIQEGELLSTTGGVYGLPLVVDPMVLYWNRDIFDKASLVAPPQYWDEIYDYAVKLTEKDTAGNIKKSAIALGETKNISNSKDIMSLLLLQAGSPITLFQYDRYHAVLTERFNLPLLPAAAAIDFYTQFANPTKRFYTWNSSLLPAQTTFTSGNSAMYLGFASELSILKAKNPTLNLAVALVPQSRVSDKKITFGKLEVVSVLKSSKNVSGAFSTAMSIISKDNASALSNIIYIPPARRDLLSTPPKDYFLSMFYTASIQSRGWLDPDERKTGSIFVDMINGVTSGRASTQEAINTANVSIDSLINP